MNKNWKVRSMASLFVIAISPSMFAEPSSGPLHLMKTPISLMDWGIYQLDVFMSKHLNGHINTFSHSWNGVWGGAEYSWDENTIWLKSYFPTTDGSQETCKKAAAATKEAILLTTGLGFRTAAEAQENAAAFLEDKFSHKAGYIDKSSPENIDQSLVKITKIEASVYRRDSQGISARSFRCRTTFYSNEIAVISD